MFGEGEEVILNITKKRKIQKFLEIAHVINRLFW